MKVTLIKEDQPEKTRWLVEMDDDEVHELLTATVFATQMRRGNKDREMIAAKTVVALCDKKAAERTQFESDQRVLNGMENSGVARFIFQTSKAIRETTTTKEKGPS